MFLQWQLPRPATQAAAVLAALSAMIDSDRLYGKMRGLPMITDLMYWLIVRASLVDWLFVATENPFCFDQSAPIAGQIDLVFVGRLSQPAQE